MSGMALSLSLRSGIVRKGRVGLAVGLVLAGCGTLPRDMGKSLAADGRPAGGGVLGGAGTDAEPRAFGRADVIARSAEVLADAVRRGDGETLRRFDRYARGADPDAAATRTMARRALALADEWRVPAAAEHRLLLERIATGRVKPLPAAEPRPIAFPGDEGAHFDAITEWWYLNGHLQGGERTLGYEFTLFRVGPVLFWAHVALTDETGQAFYHVRDWYLPGRTASSEAGLDTRYGTERIRATGKGRYRLEATVGEGVRFDLDMTSLKTPLLVNGDGNIDMPEGRDSRYYSLTRLQSAGTVRLGDRTLPVTGTSWLDHQWGPFYVSGFREVWDWFSVQADDGTDYNLFAFRDAQGTPVARYVNRLDAQGRFHGGGRLDVERVGSWFSARSGLAYTTRWVLGLPDAGERIALEATVPHQEVARLAPFPLDPLPVYWEGSMRVAKVGIDGRQVGGFAYCETFGFKK